MTQSTRYMTAALVASTTFVIFNIIAVTQGSADNYYRNIEQFIIAIVPTF